MGGVGGWSRSSREAEWREKERAKRRKRERERDAERAKEREQQKRQREEVGERPKGPRALVGPANPPTAAGVSPKRLVQTWMDM